MEGRFSLFDLLVLFGIVQGIITSVLLLLSKKNSKSNKYLAFAILSFCLLSVKMLLHTLGLREDPFFRYFPIGVELLIAPLMYFYVTTLLNPKFKLRVKDILHFIPFIASQGYSFFIFFLVFSYDSIAEKDHIAESFYFNFVKNTEDYLVLFSIAGYLAGCYFKLKKYRQWIENTTSDNTYPNLNWLRNMLILSMVLGIFLLINLASDALLNLNVSYFFHWQVYYIFITSLIYYFGFVGYMQPEFQAETSEDHTRNNETEKLSSEDIGEIQSRLRKAINNDKVFLNPTINIKELANILDVSQNKLSYVINMSFKKKFRDWINHYRVEEVKMKLNDEKYKHMSILGIALECGFNSEASFYRLFRKNTGLSPNEYIRQSKR